MAVVEAHLKDVSFVVYNRKSKGYLKKLNFDINIIKFICKFRKVYMRIYPLTEHPHVINAIGKQVITSHVSSISYYKKLDTWVVYTSNGTRYHLLID